VSGRAFEKNFTDIMKHYRNQPQAASHVYRSVLLRRRQPPLPSAEEQQQPNAGGEMPAADDVDKATTSTGGAAAATVRPAAEGLPPTGSQSQTTQPPPTPTRMANRSTVGDDGSERGDLICFYNTGTSSKNNLGFKNNLCTSITYKY
jgi:Retinoblastoma-associated protein B domain